MSKLVVTTFLSLDGVMQAPGAPDEDRSGGFDQGGWLVPFADEDMMRIVVDWIALADGFLLGRRTYEIFAAYWPRVTDPNDPVARALNTLSKYVVSKTLDKAEWNNSTLIQGDVLEEIKKLKRRPGKELQVHGSGALTQTLIANDLVERVSPVVVPGRAGPWPASLWSWGRADHSETRQQQDDQYRGRDPYVPASWRNAIRIGGGHRMAGGVSAAV